MIRIRGPDQVRRIDDPGIRRLVEQRFADVCNGEPYDYDTHGEMIVVEPGDSVDALEKQSGCSIVSNPFDCEQALKFDQDCGLTGVER